MTIHFQLACEARDFLSRASYSNFKVGAHLVTSEGFLQAGNVESGSSSNSICAERMVIGLALMKGYIPLHLHLVSDSCNPTSPCGTCRQFMSDFPSLKVSFYSRDGTKKITKTARQLLPIVYSRVV